MARRKTNPEEAADQEISKVTHRRPKPPHQKRVAKVSGHFSGSFLSESVSEVHKNHVSVSEPTSELQIFYLSESVSESMSELMSEPMSVSESEPLSESKVSRKK